MATTEEVKKLAALARIRVEDSELNKFTEEFDAILNYVGQLGRLKLSNDKKAKTPLRNVMREDDNPTLTGSNTEKIIEQFPARDGNALSVKQIISYEQRE